MGYDRILKAMRRKKGAEKAGKMGQNGECSWGILSGWFWAAGHTLTHTSSAR